MFGEAAQADQKTSQPWQRATNKVMDMLKKSVPTIIVCLVVIAFVFRVIKARNIVTGQA